MLSNIEQVTGYRYLCVSQHLIDHRADHRRDCWIKWTNLTVSYIGQIRLFSLLKATGNCYRACPVTVTGKLGARLGSNHLIQPFG